MRQLRRGLTGPRPDISAEILATMDRHQPHFVYTGCGVWRGFAPRGRLAHTMTMGEKKRWYGHEMTDRKRSRASPTP
ncbi:hypothetical protein CHELA40_14784 [Chelatococcus asaccharovorans]|nr:hypothetical protein CHELA17_60837 [Chelatococcus asaccharovorans]CAH1679952.1 hypothetical protein CHELA40_14784 [Chelatococcus asaccharovorans]